MITLISGTNRPDCNTLKVARIVESLLRDLGEEVRFLNLQKLPPAIFDPSSYAGKPPEFAPFQEAILEAQGILVVTPEYNGSFPGVLKYFIDMLKFPESLSGVPAGFVGLAAGEWGALRSIEQIELIFQYRSAHLYGRRVFLKGIHRLLDEQGQLKDAALAERLATMVLGFVEFARSVAKADPKADRERGFRAQSSRNRSRPKV